MHYKIWTEGTKKKKGKSKKEEEDKDIFVNKVESKKERKKQLKSNYVHK